MHDRVVAGANNLSHGTADVLVFVVSVHTRFVGLFSAAVVAALALPFVRPEGVLGQVLLVAGIVMIIGGVSFGLLAAQPVWLPLTQY